MYPPVPLARFNSILAALPTVPKTILELGCGDWENYSVLRKHFPSARIIGVDLRCVNLPKFVQADVRALPFATAFNLVLIRHPDVHRSSDAWQFFLSQADQWIALGGVLLVTTYSAAEVETIRGWLPELTPLSIDLSRLSPVDMIGQDRYFFALSKPINA